MTGRGCSALRLQALPPRPRAALPRSVGSGVDASSADSSCGRNCAGHPLSVHSRLVLEGFLPYDTALGPKMSPFALPGRPLTPSGRWVCLGLAGLLGGLLLLATSVRPDPRGFGTHEQLGLAPCAFRVLLNLPCPTCGGTTSFAHFVRGHWSEAFHANPAAFAFALSCSLLTPWLVLSAVVGRLPGVVRADWAFIILVAILASLGLSSWLLQLLPALR